MVYVDMFCPINKEGRCRDDCAWYDNEHELCAIWLIANSLEGVELGYKARNPLKEINK